MSKLVDLTGQTFGKWTVVERALNDKNGNAMWLCECSCENKTKRTVLGHSLRNESSRSCGCERSESCRKALAEINKRTKKKYNTYDLSGEYGIGYTFKGEEFYFDLEDYDKIKDYCWHIRDDGYVATNDFNNNFKIIRMHNLLFPHAKYVDHKHGENTKNDNRKSNLRICTSSQNNMNRKLFSNNTSGITGVHWHKAINKWIAYIKVNKKQIHLGSFNDFEDAVKTRKEAEEKYFGEFSYDNSVKDGGN